MYNPHQHMSKEMIFTEHDTTEHVNEKQNSPQVHYAPWRGSVPADFVAVSNPSSFFPFFCDDQHWSAFFLMMFTYDGKENSYHAFQVCPQRVNVTQIVETQQ